MIKLALLWCGFIAAAATTMLLAGLAALLLTKLLQ